MLTDDLLRKYLDGTASEAEICAVEDAAAEDVAVQDRLQALDPMAAQVAAAFANVAPQDLDMAPAPAAQGWRVAAGVAAAVVFGCGVLVGASYDRTPPMTWTMAVADYQVLYSAQTIAPLDPAPAELLAQLDSAGAAIGADLAGLAGMDLAGAQLLRAQVLGLNGTPIVQLVYGSPDGVPVALCLTRKSVEKSDKPDLTLRGLDAAFWQTAAHEALLIGGVGDARLAEMRAAAQALTTNI